MRRTVAPTPMRSNSRRALGHRPIPAPAARMADACSSTVTSWPISRRDAAVVSPTRPPPTMTVRKPRSSRHRRRPAPASSEEATGDYFKCMVLISSITFMHLDLNLLIALDALLDEGSVGAAAHRLHLSQPAMSRTLGRIRRATGDEILVRA